MSNISCGVPMLDIRLWFHIAAFVHLFITAIVTLSIDPTVDEDPRLRKYISVRWKLLTCWFNLITLAYLPLCLYCEIKEKQGFGESKYTRRVRYVTDVIMTSILFPTTMTADILFWTLMNTNIELMAPTKLFDYMPYWSQHSLHSVSIAVVILDLLLTPRSRPKSLQKRFLLATAFSILYTLTIYICYLRGEVVYTFIETFSAAQIFLFISFTYILFITFYFIQWKIIDFFWGKSDEVKFQKKV